MQGSICEESLVQTLSCTTNAPKSKPIWQYHSRSDHHSKILSISLLLDLIKHCKVLQRQIVQNQVAFGINHRITDKSSGKHKDLDLVLFTPESNSQDSGSSLSTYAASLPNFSPQGNGELILSKYGQMPQSKTGGLLLTVEAKAIMTEFTKAFPRLSDELVSSQRIVCNSGLSCLTVAAVMINHSPSFVSPLLNDNPCDPVYKESRNHQAKVELCYTQVLKGLPIKNFENSQMGYDEILALDIFMKNDGSEVSVVNNYPKPEGCEQFAYAAGLKRLAAEYTAKWGCI